MLQEATNIEEPEDLRLARRGRFIVCRPHELEGDYRGFVKRREALHLFAASARAPAILIDCRKDDVAVPPEVFAAISRWPGRPSAMTWCIAMLLPDPCSRREIQAARTLSTLLSSMRHKVGLFGDYPSAAAWLSGQFRGALRQVH